MTVAAITTYALGKRYRLGAAPRRSDSLRDAIAQFVRRGARAREDGGATIWALRDVSFEIATGEVVGVIGRNGAGKSTLLKILSRITEPSAGWATVRGRVGSLLEIGTGFHPDLTGRDNVFLSAAMLGMDRRAVRSRFAEIVEFAGVAAFIDTPVKRYSSGMYLRLAFAVAAHLETENLIVDEVLAVGDAEFQKKCLGRMRRVSEEGRTVLFVSHNLPAIRALCPRALRLDGGRVVADGCATDVVDRYLAEADAAVLVREWAVASEAPYSDLVRLRRVAARTAAGEPLRDLTTDAPFRVDIEYDVVRASARVGLTIYLMDAEERCVLTTLNNREPCWYGRPMPCGTYRTSCSVPGGLLNNGTFAIWVNLFGPNFSDNHLVRDVLRLEVGDGATLRHDYFGPFLGSVRPDLAWATEAMEEPRGD
jgi:lipopolysaccharide transport system ATP-binding protein